MSYYFQLFAFSLFALLLTACGGGGGGSSNDSGPPPSAELASIALTPVDALLVVGDTLQFTAIGTYKDATTRDLTSSITWSSIGGARVNANGLVTGTSADSAIIIASDIPSTVVKSAILEVTKWRSEGAQASPVTLSLGLAHDGIVDRNKSYYQVAVESGIAYYIFLNNPVSDNVGDRGKLIAFDDALAAIPLCTGLSYEFDADGKFDDLRCVTNPTPSTAVLYFQVDGSDVGFFDPGMTYDLLVKRGYLNEGTSANRAVFSLDTPYSGEAGPGPFGSFYSVPVNEGGEYLVTLTSISDEADLILPTGFGQSECMIAQTGMTEESCKIIVDSDSLNFEVTSNLSLTGSGFTLTVTETRAAYIPEGSLANPDSLTVGVPRPAQVNNQSSFYSFASTPGRSYKVTLTGQDNQATLLIFDGSAGYIEQTKKHNFSSYNADCRSANTFNADELCLLEPASADSIVYVEVDGHFSSYGTAYIVLVEEISYAAEGTVTPYPVGSVPVSYRGQVDGAESFYQATVAVGATYNIALTSLSGDVDLYVYDDAGHTTLLCSSTETALIDEACRLTPANPVSATVMYIKVVSNSSIGAAYTLEVDRSYNDEGSKASPIDLIIDTPYDAQVRNDILGNPDAGISYYRVPVITGNTYEIVLSNVSNNDNVGVSVGENDPDFTSGSPGICINVDTGCLPKASTVDGYWHIWARSTTSEFGAGFTIIINDLTP